MRKERLGGFVLAGFCLLGSGVSRAQGPAPTAKAAGAPVVRYELQPAEGGGYSYSSSSFAARIRQDGSVEFLPRGFFSLRTGPARPQEVGRNPITAREGPAPGPVEVVDGRPGIRFDLADEYVRRLGKKDPARVEKAAFLAATFDLRAKMMHADRRRSLAESVDQLSSRLEELWSDPKLTESERKRILQLWWAELETGPEAEPAARVIEEFAKRRLSPAEAATFQRPRP